MKKSNYISFFILLFITIIAISTLIILIGRDKRAQKEALKQTSQEQITPTAPVPSPTPSPAITPALEPTQAPEKEKTVHLYPAYIIEKDEKKYGYIDNTGSFVISPTFNTATAFNDGAAVVRMGNKNLAIDTEGKIIYSNSTSLSEFANGAAVFSDDSTGSSLYGYIDTKGKVIIEAQFKYAWNFRADNTAYVITTDDSYALIDKTGNILENYIKAKDIKSNESFHDGYLIYYENPKDYSLYFKYGIKNIKGEILVKAEYSSIRYLGDGYFAVTKPGLDFNETLYASQALMNASGTLLTDYKYYNINDIYNGVMSVTDETSTFFIDTNGNRMASLPVFDGIGSLKYYGKDLDVIEADIDGQKLYCNNKKIIFWQEDLSYELAEGIIVRTKKFRPNRLALVNYPYIEGIWDDDIEDAINLALEKIFTEPRKDLSVQDATEVNDVFSAKLLGNLLIIERSGYDYTYGAAHGNPFKYYYHIDIRTGRFYKFKELFKEDTDYVSKINEMISDEISRNLASEDSLFYDGELGFKTISEEPLFMLDKDTITIYFAPYEIAPYAAGFPEFIIPFDDIESYINKQGDFYRSFN